MTPARAGAVVAAAIFAIAAPARADADAEADADAGEVLIARGSRWEVSLATATRQARQLAGVALGGLDVAAGRRDAGISIEGDQAAGQPPPAWPLANRDGAVVATASLGMGKTKKECRCTTPLSEVAPVGDHDRVAVLWATARFEVGEAQRDLHVLDLRARYGDGIVVWINGVEVARRRVERDARPMQMAGVVRGPEWETFHVPVVPGLLRAGDNVVAAEVRPSARSSGTRFDLELIGRPAATLVRGPVVQRVTTTEATIVVETDLPADAAVEWGTTDALGTRVESSAGRARRHDIALTDLPASAPVFYRVIAAGAATPVRSFRTLPGPGEVVRIAVYGDVRGGHRTHADVIARIRDDDPDLVLATGDLVLRGTDAGDWDRFFAITGEMLATVPFWSAPGNHDTGRSGDARRRFNDVFLLPPLVAGAPARRAWDSWYSFDAGSVHVVLLDSNAYDERSQLDWLELDLQAARDRGAKVLLAAVHDGPYSRGSHGGNQTAVKLFVPVLVKHGVAMIFSGHDHIYQRGTQDGLPYVVTGGGGASLYPQKCGAPGKRACKVEDGMAHFAKLHHYVLVSAYPDFIEVCPKLVDGTALEACVKYQVRTP